MLKSQNTATPKKQPNAFTAKSAMINNYKPFESNSVATSLRMPRAKLPPTQGKPESDKPQTDLDLNKAHKLSKKF